MNYGKKHEKPSFYSLYELEHGFRGFDGKSTAMKGELELFQETHDMVMSSSTTNEEYLASFAPTVKKYLHIIAEHLLEKGMNPGSFSLQRALEMTRNVGAPKFVKALLEAHPEEVVRLMKGEHLGRKFGI